MSAQNIQQSPRGTSRSPQPIHSDQKILLHQTIPDGGVKTMRELALVQEALLLRTASFSHNLYVVQTSQSEFFSRSVSSRFGVSSRCDQLAQILRNGARVMLVFSKSSASEPMPKGLDHLQRAYPVLEGERPSGISISFIGSPAKVKVGQLPTLWFSGGCSAIDGIGHCNILEGSARAGYSRDQLQAASLTPNVSAYSDTPASVIALDKNILFLRAAIGHAGLPLAVLKQEVFEIEGLRDRLNRQPTPTDLNTSFF